MHRPPRSKPQRPWNHNVVTPKPLWEFFFPTQMIHILLQGFPKTAPKSIRAFQNKMTHNFFKWIRNDYSKLYDVAIWWDPMMGHANLGFWGGMGLHFVRSPRHVSYHSGWIWQELMNLKCFGSCGENFLCIYMYIFSVTGKIYIIKCHKIYMIQIREVVFSATHRHLQGSKHHRWLFKEQRCLSSSFLEDTKRVRRCENTWICWIFLMTCYVVRNGLKLSMVSGNSHVHHFRTSRCCTLLWRASTMRLRRRSFRMVIWSQKHSRTVGDS